LKIFLCVCFIVLSVSGAVADQAAGAPVPTQLVTVAGTTTLDDIRNAFTSGDMKEIHDAAIALIHELIAANVQIENPKTTYVRLVFVARKMSGELILAQVLVHDPAPRLNTMDGLKGDKHPLATVLVHDDATVAIHTVMMPTEQPNPLQADLAALAAAVLSKTALPSGIAYGAPVKSAAVPAKTFTVGVAVTTLTVPFARAKLALDDTLVLPDPVAYLQGQFNALNRRAPSGAACIKTAVDKLDKFSTDPKVKGACTATGTTKDCATEARGTVKKLYEEALATCATDADREALASIVRQNVSAIPDDLKPLTAHIELVNVPLSRVTVGLASGFIGWVTNASAARVQIQNGNIAANPIPRPLSLGIVNVYCKPFDSQSSSITPNERVRFFTGLTLAPLFGPVAGVGYGLSRAIALNVGVAFLLFDVRRGTDEIGKAPSDPAKPFGVGHALGWFGAVSYNLK